MNIFSRIKNRKTVLFSKFFYFLVTTLVLFTLTQNWSYDDPFITYRYVSNILSGNGFVYNPGEHVLSTTTPLFAILLASLRWIWSDLPQLAVFIGSASLAVGGLILFRLASIYKTPIIGWICLLLYPTFPLLISTLSSETPIYLAFILGAILAYDEEKYLGAGLFSGLAVLTRPDGLLVPALIAVHFLFFRFGHRPFPWKAIFLFSLVIFAWFGYSWLYFGSPLPVTLVAKQQQGMMAISQRFLPGLITVINYYSSNWGYRTAAALMAIGSVLILKERRWWLFFIWTVVYFTAFSILGVSRYYWYYAPLVPGFVILVGTGLSGIWNLRNILRGRFYFFATGAVSILFIFLVFTQFIGLWRFRNFRDDRIPVYTEVGQWLSENVASTATVGALEVGAIGYYSQRKMIDFAGLIQPDVAKQLTHDTTYEDSAMYAVSQYQPDYIALNSGIFPKLRESSIARYCQSIKSFQNGNVGIDLFECHWD
jgi:hypothetical protein